MVAPRGLARFNRRVTNPVARRFAGRVPGFGIITHVGRRSERSYRTPVLVFARPGGVSVALTYGTEADWVRNVLAAGRCELLAGGRRRTLGSPRVVHDPTRQDVPGPLRPLLRLLGAGDFMHLADEVARPVDDGPGALG